MENRYIRQEMIKSIGQHGQLSLHNSRVLIIGAGGLGSPIAVYLTGAGVGHITIVDFDKVNISNLHRQVWFTMDDIGRSKAEVLSAHCRRLNPDITVIHQDVRLDKENIDKFLVNNTIVIDATDNFETRYLINDACLLLGHTLIFGAVYQYEGQVAVFNHDEKHISYRDIFAEPPPSGTVPSCNTAGVIGPAVSCVASYMACETIKVILNDNSILNGILLSIDLKTLQHFKLKIKKIYDHTSLDYKQIDYQYICNRNSTNSNMKSITVKELKELIDQKADIQVIDVREAHEYAEMNMGAQLMPLSELDKHVNDIDDEKQVIVHCRSGARSASAIDHLSKVHGFNNLYNLTGGILAWKEL